MSSYSAAEMGKLEGIVGYSFPLLPAPFVYATTAVALLNTFVDTIPPQTQRREPPTPLCQRGPNTTQRAANALHFELWRPSTYRLLKVQHICYRLCHVGTSLPLPSPLCGGRNSA